MTKFLEDSFIPFQCEIVSRHNKFNIEGITSAQYNVLELVQTQGPKTTNELASALGITVSGISKLTKKLLQKGLIEQQRSQADRRYYHIVLTEAGESFLRKAENSRKEIIQLIGKALSKEEIEAFSRICSKLNTYLTDHKAK
ncbi:MarR family winged helix-turn-helix transcriptional regulator [Brevibacillus laterosporus]|uniref:MarR family winged helix-turn-helix transcriptional regulator n=1 Tax=Brevibacillus laterosporus TaxID=1465 RepID=UPI00264EDA9E|nr:MarR family transcriptional regulator [Brevibacillus laterosporus]MDN9011657.1 MarR family transcriptional regulator [Brevibacillus laterosporus]MDO0942657.1 MarR family transcriptional regulator [Brevibacillus laterosporus]